MFKKYIAIIFLCISNFILVGHNLVQHHHYEEHGFVHEDAHHDHHHHEDSNHHDKDHNSPDEHSVLSNILAHFAHSEILLKGADDLDIKVDLNKIEPIAVLDTYFVKPVVYTPIPIKQTCYHFKEPEYHSFSRLPFGLRGPPVVA